MLCKLFWKTVSKHLTHSDKPDFFCGKGDSLLGTSVLTLLDGDSWHRYLLKLGITDFYFTPEYAELCGAVANGDSNCFVYEEFDNVYLYPFRKRQLPKSIHCVTGAGFFDITSDYGYGGPISNCFDDEFLERANAEFCNWCEEQRIVTEFVRFHPMLENYSYLDTFYDLLFLNDTVVVKLDGEDQMLSSFRKVHRYDIKRSFRERYIIRQGLGCDDWLTFRQIYVSTMDSLGAEDYYFFPEDYFLFLERQDKKAFLLLAEMDNQVIGGACFFKTNGFLHYHLSGNVRKFSTLGVSKRILHEAFKIGYSEGLKYAHLGGGFAGRDSDSLMAFKSGFSSLRRKYFVAKRVVNSGMYQKICEFLQAPCNMGDFFPAYRNPKIINF